MRRNIGFLVKVILIFMFSLSASAEPGVGWSATEKMIENTIHIVVVGMIIGDLSIVLWRIIPILKIFLEKYWKSLGLLFIVGCFMLTQLTAISYGNLGLLLIGSILGLSSTGSSGKYFVFWMLGLLALDGLWVMVVAISSSKFLLFVSVQQLIVIGPLLAWFVLRALVVRECLRVTTCKAS